jgi:hypothetical protein
MDAFAMSFVGHYRVTRCFAFNAVDFTFSLRSLVTTLVASLATGVVLVTVFVVFLTLAVAVVAAAVSLPFAEAEASLVSFLGAI